MALKVTILTLFPEWFAGPLGESILGRARQQCLLEVALVQIRDFAADRHRSVDAPPFGGGGGMLMSAPVTAAAMDAAFGAPGSADRAHVIYLSPRGRPFDQRRAEELARLPHIGLLCGRYEGIDERLLETRVDEELSLGDFVLTGGDIAAMAVVDAVARMVPGVLGNDESAGRDSFMEGTLEAPHYTRPEEFEGRGVPEVLLSGNHAAIAAWREEEGLRLTRERRPDLFEALLLHPAQVRRLARRARPFAVLRAPGEVLFAGRQVRALADFPAEAWRRRFEEGLTPGVRIVEFRELASGDEGADRAALLEDVEAALGEQGPAGTFLRNLRRAIQTLV